MGLAEALREHVRRFRRLLQHLIQGFGIDDALLEGLVEALHHARNGRVISAVRLHQLRNGAGELDRIIDRENIRTGFGKVGNITRHVGIGQTGGVRLLEHLPLHGVHVLHLADRTRDLLVGGAELFHEGVDLRQAEPDADCTEQLRGRTLDALDGVVDLFDIAFAYFEADLVDKLRNRHEQSPSFHGRFDRSVLTVPLKTDRISFISRKAIFQRGAHDHGKHGSRR